MLLGAFIAGNVAAQLKEGAAKNHSYEGVLQVIATYTQLRVTKRVDPVKSIDQWIELQKTGGLKAFLEKQIEQAHRDAAKQPPDADKQPTPGEPRP